MIFRFKRNNRIIKMTIKQTLSLSKTQQLVDLNGETANFDLTFNVNCKTKDSFQVVVVDQATLDNNPELEYRNTDDGQISGNIISDKNIYQNYFLCLKSEKPCIVDITIDKKEIEPKPEIPMESNSEQNTTKPTAPLNNIKNSHLQHPKPRKINWKLILIVLIVIAGGLFIYYFFIKKTTDSNVDKGFKLGEEPNLTSNIFENSIDNKQNLSPVSINSSMYSSVQSSPQSTPQSSPQPSQVTNFGFSGHNSNNSLIDRLNNLPLK